jgi:4,5-dihydroxyphthalate decarboxylase
MHTLTTVLGDYPHARALQDGSAAVAGYRMEPVRVEPVIGAYRRMIRDLEFDVCELAPVSYLMARQTGVPLTAIPVFLNRRFHHSDVQCAALSGIERPRDLEGRGVWVRGILREEYGVELEKIEWVVDDEDHVEGRNPANVAPVTDGRSLGELLRAGEIDAALSGNAGTGRAGKPRAGWAASAAAAPAAEEGSQGPYPLFPDAEVLAADWYLRTGVYPLHSVIAIRGELVERDPGLPSALYAAFAESKRLHTAADPDWSALPRFAKQAGQIGGDPVPYGIEANAPSIDALVRYCADQGLYDTDGPTDLRTLFADGDYQNA